MGLPAVVGAAMSTMSQDIWNNPDQFPAVTELDAGAIDGAALRAALMLRDFRFAFVVLEPDDGTRYELAIVPSLGIAGAPYRFGSSFGALYPWMGEPSIHPDYAKEHYVSNGNPWTATVFALFLNTVAEIIGMWR